MGLLKRPKNMMAFVVIQGNTILCGENLLRKVKAILTSEDPEARDGLAESINVYFDFLIINKCAGNNFSRATIDRDREDREVIILDTGDFPYEIDIYECLTPKQISAWIGHLSKKIWGLAVLVDFLKILRQINRI